MKIVILQFSGREHGNCGNVATFISEYCQKMNPTIHWIHGDAAAPCGECDYQCLKPDQICPRQQRILDDVMDGDLVFYIVPNYCGYPCANYFGFNERTVGYFNGDRQKMTRYLQIPKRFILVSNSTGWEAAMAQQTNQEPVCFYLKSGKYGKQSIAGNLMDVPEAQQDLEHFLASALQAIGEES